MNGFKEGWGPKILSSFRKSLKAGYVTSSPIGSVIFDKNHKLPVTIGKLMNTLNITQK